MSSIYIFGDGQEAIAKPEKVMKSALEKFSEEQARSVMSLLEAIRIIDDSNAGAKEKFIGKINNEFEKLFGQKGNW